MSNSVYTGQRNLLVRTRLDMTAMEQRQSTYPLRLHNITYKCLLPGYLLKQIVLNASGVHTN